MLSGSFIFCYKDVFIKSKQSTHYYLIFIILYGWRLARPGRRPRGWVLEMAMRAEAALWAFGIELANRNLECTLSEKCFWLMLNSRKGSKVFWLIPV